MNCPHSCINSCYHALGKQVAAKACKTWGDIFLLCCFVDHNSWFLLIPNVYETGKWGWSILNVKEFLPK